MRSVWAMPKVTVLPSGGLKVGAKTLFPIGISLPPPPDGKAPAGRDGLAELAAAGVTFVRTGMVGWNDEFVDAQIAAERKRLDAAAAHGLHCWPWLGELTDLPLVKPGEPPSLKEQVLAKVVNALKGHDGLLAWKSVDEPRNPFRGENWIRPAGVVRGYEKLKSLDPNHPVVIIQTPVNTVAELTPYRPAFDITGADIYPVSYPPGTHVGSKTADVSVVGDVTRTLRAAAGAKPIWMTLQIAWSGVAPSASKPNQVPRFPTLHEERFMTYQAIANGARGVNYFGGHLTQVTTPQDAALGWNWSFWEQTLRPIVRELASPELQVALVAPDLKPGVKTENAAIELVTRQTTNYVFVIAVRRGGATSRVAFTGLPKRKDGTPITTGRVLFEYDQRPLPPPIKPESQTFRPITVANGRFEDWFAPHDAHVYRFAL
jgi:hypothetical protein